VPKVPPEWYYARLQAAGRAQSRYLLLVLLISAYTLGLRYSTAEVVRVAIVGLELPKAIVNAFAALILSVLLVALFGTFEAVHVAVNHLRARFWPEATDLGVYSIDAHPNVADFLSYATFVEGQHSWMSRAGWALYPIPAAAVFAWTFELWLTEVVARPYYEPWLVWVYAATALPLTGATVRLFFFVRGRWLRARMRAGASGEPVGTPRA